MRATSAICGSLRRAVTSFRISAPAAAAISATCDLLVSTEIGILSLPRRLSITGMTRRSSSSAEIPVEPGRVDSPPMSMMCAPARSMAMACAAAASGSRKRPPSEKLSGVTLSTPMMSVRSPSSRRVRRETQLEFSAMKHRRLLKHDLGERLSAGGRTVFASARRERSRRCDARPWDRHGRLLRRVVGASRNAGRRWRWRRGKILACIRRGFLARFGGRCRLEVSASRRK